MAAADYVTRSTLYWAAFQVLGILPALLVYPLLAERLGTPPWHLVSGTGAGVFYFTGLTAIAAVSLKVRARVDPVPDSIMPLILAAIVSFLCATALTVHNLSAPEPDTAFSALEWISMLLGTVITIVTLHRHFVYYGLNYDRELDAIPRADAAAVEGLNNDEPRSARVGGKDIPLEDDD